jgi:hypothetical protein
MITKKNPISKDQSGVALVVALIMMTVLTLIGLASMSGSIFEITLTGNRREAAENFYKNDATMQSLLPNQANFPTELPDREIIEEEDKPDDVRDEPVDSKTPNLTAPSPPGVSFKNKPAVAIYHLDQKDGPRGVGISVTNFEFQHFIIDVKEGTTIQSNNHLREKVVKLVPTSQGGAQ